ncbi:MAG: glucose-1-phosphate cytidylyltransferase [Elusimicrobia bacterium RIFCSPLOWO2_12_FULL_59_9]|nr:MAG: glucose-1-phosphate cytidylyltransferase [Elusimicrobia bacterium RIFCSPLOWO2_12_FULL_59_9]
MPVIILCGGRGTRLQEEAEIKPKPLVDIGNRPILWHIMKTYAHFGFRRFILCLGYKGSMIRQYFLNYEVAHEDFTIRLGQTKKIRVHRPHQEQGWEVTLAETGPTAQTGARLKRVEKYVNSSLFMLTYGDGLADISIPELLEFHLSHGKIGTVTGVPPIPRFGELNAQGHEVKGFLEKPAVHGGLINGGFFVFQKEFFSYLSAEDGCVLEKEPMARLAKDHQLMVYRHQGFWQCMDTFRDCQLLNDIWARGHATWKVWD